MAEAFDPRASSDTETGIDLGRRLAPGTLVAPLLAALAPFAGAAISVIPSAILAGPLALFTQAGEA